jgi:hypothetical protein
LLIAVICELITLPWLDMAPIAALRVPETLINAIFTAPDAEVTDPFKLPEIMATVFATALMLVLSVLERLSILVFKAADVVVMLLPRFAEVLTSAALSDAE